MAHTVEEKKKLLNRVRRIKGQVEAIERTLDQEAECSDVLHNISACRGAMDALMAEVIEGHIRFHVLDPEDAAYRRAGAGGRRSDSRSQSLPEIERVSDMAKRFVIVSGLPGSRIWRGNWPRRLVFRSLIRTRFWSISSK